MSWMIGPDYVPGPKVTTDPEVRAAIKVVVEAEKLEAIRAGLHFDTKLAGFMSGEAFTLFDETPPKIRIDAYSKGYEDQFPTIMFACGTYLIPQEVIDLIESIEPGVHRYVATDLAFSDGSPPDRPRWLLNIMTRQEALDIEASNVKPWGPPVRATGDVRWYGIINKIGSIHGASLEEVRAKPLDVYLKRNMVTGRAVWREERLDQGVILWGNAFVEGLMAMPQRSGFLPKFFLPER